MLLEIDVIKSTVVDIALRVSVDLSEEFIYGLATQIKMFGGSYRGT